MAFEGQDFKHGGSSQCMQRMGRNISLAFGYLPNSFWTTGAHQMFPGELFSILQATEQASQPIHFARSINILKRANSGYMRLPKRLDITFLFSDRLMAD
jgi:hypothetical protein